MERKIPAKGIAQVSPSVEPSSPAEAKAAIGASVPPRASTRRITENIIKKTPSLLPPSSGSTLLAGVYQQFNLKSVRWKNRKLVHLGEK